jgi:hypothetical protein
MCPTLTDRSGRSNQASLRPGLRLELIYVANTSVFSPAVAAEILRSLGLTEMTECALRTRAYRKQVPFHLNGRRITFTIGDLRMIAEGTAAVLSPEPTAPSPNG